MHEVPVRTRRAASGRRRLREAERIFRSMEPLDLTKRPPRGPREKLDGLVLMPRTIDKLRAMLPGGKLGAYKIPGFSARVLEKIGVKEDELLEAVRRASSDDDVAAWLRARADTSKY